MSQAAKREAAHSDFEALPKGVTLPAGLVLHTKDYIKRNQDTIRKSLIRTDQLIHNNAMDCMVHMYVHGDTSLMRRLIIDIAGKDTGYRRQGIIAWMRAYSPAELKGDIINLSGMRNGVKRPFDLKTANETPFWTSRKFDEAIARPVFRENFMAKIDLAYREFIKAVENTVNGKPIDPSKPFFDGKHTEKVLDFFEEVKKLKENLPSDDTKVVTEAKLRLKQDLDLVKAYEGSDTKPDAVIEEVQKMTG